VTESHARAIECLSAGVSLSAAAEAVGVQRETLSRWLRDPEHPVSRSLEEMREGIVAQARGRLREHALDAVSVLRTIMADDTAPHAARIAAARDILARAGVVEAIEHRVTAGPSPADDVSLARRLADAEGYLDADDPADGG
jgi:predicted amidohydrolase YtcJ